MRIHEITDDQTLYDRAFKWCELVGWEDWGWSKSPPGLKLSNSSSVHGERLSRPDAPNIIKCARRLLVDGGDMSKFEDRLPEHIASLHLDKVKFDRGFSASKIPSHYDEDLVLTDCHGLTSLSGI